MKKICLTLMGLMILGMVTFGAGPAIAASAAGPYYATPSWDQKLDASTRFVILTNWGSAAVLDRETGLVWEQSPLTNLRNWADALSFCNYYLLGGRLGWRLPTVQELASLVDPLSAGRPTLPAGHPFSDVQSSFYWSATTYAPSTSSAWRVNFYVPAVGTDNKEAGHYVWCVRGGQGVDPQ